MSIITSLGIAGAAHSDFDDAEAAAKREDFETAAAELKPLADKGHDEAQYQLAVLFAFGKGVPLDYEQAVRWLQRSSNQGYAPAQFRLGQHLYGGIGVERNRDEGIFWIGVASSQGFEPANSWANETELKLSEKEERKLIKRVSQWRPRPETYPVASEPDITPTARVDPPLPKAPSVEVDRQLAKAPSVEVDPPRPKARSVEVATPTAVDPRIVAKAAATIEGSHLQIGSLRSQEAAVAERSRILLRVGDLLDDARINIIRANLGPPNGVYYRLRIGPLPDQEKVAALCKTLRGLGLRCFVVEPGE